MTMKRPTLHSPNSGLHIPLAMLLLFASCTDHVRLCTMNDVTSYFAEHSLGHGGCTYVFSADGTFTATPQSFSGSENNDPVETYHGTWRLESIDRNCEGRLLEAKQGIALTFTTQGRYTEGYQSNGFGYVPGVGIHLSGVINPFNGYIVFKNHNPNPGTYFNDAGEWKSGSKDMTIQIERK